MVSAGTELSLAFWMASASVALPSGLDPPSRAATSIPRISLANNLPRLASLAPFWCLIVDHFEWPDTEAPLTTKSGKHVGREGPRAVYDQLARSRTSSRNSSW